MRALHRWTAVALSCSASLIVACAPAADRVDDSASGTTAASPAATALTFASLAGTWNVRAVPETGDTTPVLSVLTATPDSTGWTMTLAGRPAMPVRVHIVGDSVISEAGPYESVMRKGVQVRTRSAFAMQGNMLTGQTVARYTTTGADSVLRLRSTGTKAPM